MKKILLFLSALLFVTPLLAQTKIITGTVKDKSNGDPLIGVTVVLKGTQVASTTDEDGKYDLAIPASGGTVVFSYVGYKTQTADVSDQPDLSIDMEKGQQILDEVVVVGYG